MLWAARDLPSSPDDEVLALWPKWGVQVVSEDPPANVPLAYPDHRELILPAYAALVVKSLRNLKEQDQTVDFSFTLVVRIGFGSIPMQARERLLEKLSFRLNDTPLSGEHDTQVQWRGSLCTLTMRIQLPGIIFQGGRLSEAYHVWKEFPFDHPTMVFRLEISAQTLDGLAEHASSLSGWKARCNLHQYQGDGSLSPAQCALAQMSFKENSDCLPNFDFDMDAVMVSFDAERKTKGSSTLVFFPSTTFHIPLFRHPGGTLRSMIFPLFVTNIGTLMTFFMSPIKYEERISTLVTVLLALFAFLSFARSALPDVPISTSIDLQIFQSVFMCLLAMLASLLGKYEFVGVPSPLPSQWSFDGQLTSSQTAMRVTRIVLFGLFNLVLLLSMLRVAHQMQLYWRKLRTNDDLEQLSRANKQRSSDFSEANYKRPESGQRREGGPEQRPEPLSTSDQPVVQLSRDAQGDTVHV